MQALGLAVGEQAEAGADLDVGVLLLELPDRGGHPGDIRVGGAAAAGDQADPLGARLTPASALLITSSGLSQVYLSTSAAEPSRCEQ